MYGRNLPILYSDYSGIKVDLPVIGEIDIPIKVRVSGRFIPDFIFDPTQQRREAGILLQLIQPEVYVQVGKQFYKINYKGEVSKSSAEEFYRPTFIDEWESLDPTVKLLILGGLGFLGFKLLKCIF